MPLKYFPIEFNEQRDYRMYANDSTNYPNFCHCVIEVLFKVDKNLETFQETDLRRVYSTVLSFDRDRFVEHAQPLQKFRWSWIWTTETTTTSMMMVMMDEQQKHLHSLIWPLKCQLQAISCHSLFSLVLCMRAFACLMNVYELAMLMRMLYFNATALFSLPLLLLLRLFLLFTAIVFAFDYLCACRAISK